MGPNEYPSDSFSRLTGDDIVIINLASALSLHHSNVVHSLSRASAEKQEWEGRHIDLPGMCTTYLVSQHTAGPLRAP